MRYVCPAAAALIAAMIFAPTSEVVAAGGPTGLSIDQNYTFVSQARATRSTSYFTYRAELANTGASLAEVTATVTSSVPGVTVLPTRNTIHFWSVPANGKATSSDTFTILIDPTVPFSFSSLSWSFDSPFANAGPAQTVPVGHTVNLNGGGSTDPLNAGPLSYSWSFASIPTGSAAVLANPQSVVPTFKSDLAGDYVVSLTVSNGIASSSSNVTISTINSAPVANAGPNQSVSVGSTVTLNGSQSYDVDGNPLTFFWSIISAPPNSTATLSGYSSASPSFTADQSGTYILGLKVNDGSATSDLSTVTVSTGDTAPVANAGPNQFVSTGTTVQLDGSHSTDVNGNPLTYKWSLPMTPAGSNATLSNASAVNPTLAVSVAGTYIAQLIVNDGTTDSAPSTVIITTNATLPPLADAGPDQSIVAGTLVTLHGSGSDPQGLPLTYKWALINVPPGSQALLSSNTATSPTFTADLPGTYIAQLITNNGHVNSTPSTVVITTGATQPVAEPGKPQSVAVGTLVTLNGSGSYSADHSPLTYSWSLLHVPAGSDASLSGGNTVSPQFSADVAGIYVAQLIVNNGSLSSDPETVAISASVRDISLSPNPLNLLLNAAATLTVKLTQPAPSGGMQVNFSGFNPSVISVPASVVVPENTTSATVTVSPLAVGTTGILASAAGYISGNTVVNVSRPSLSVSLPSGVGIAHSVTGAVTLSAPAPASGTTVILTSSATGVATVTPSLTFPSGSTTQSFTVNGITAGSATISASASDYVGGSANILVVQLGAIGLQANVVVGPGQSAPLNVMLSSPAPDGGETVTLGSSNSKTLTVTPSVFIPKGATTPATQPQVTGVAFGSATVTASAPGYLTATQTVQVSATLSFNPPSLSLGTSGSQTVLLGLSAPAPAAITVALASGNTGVAAVPSSVTIAAGASSAPVTVTAKGTGSTTISATTTTPGIGPGSLAVTVASFGGIILPSSESVGLGQSFSFPVTLSSPAPQNGITVTLASTDPTKATISPATVFIAAGQTQPASQPVLTGVSPGSAAITASAPGFISASSTVQTTASLSLAPQNITINSGITQNLTLTLSGPAPAGGITLKLAASPTGIVSLPATATILAGAKTATFAITGSAAGSTTITASSATLTNVSSATDTITVQALGAIQLPSGVTLAPGQSLPFAVTLPSAAPSGGVTVQLSSSDTTKVTISPLSVTILAGQTQPGTQPQVTGVGFGSATITASAKGYSTGSQLVTVASKLTLTPTPLTLTGPQSQNLTLTLSAPAPSALVFNLAASPTGIVTIPSSATIAQGATTVSFPATATGLGTTTITATPTVSNISTASASVTVASGGALSLPSGVTLAAGESEAFQVTLPAAAPAGGVTVTLISSDTTKVTISPTTVTIAGGAKQPVTAPQVTAVAAGSATITASAPLYSSASQSVHVNGAIALTPQNPTIAATNSQTLTLTVSIPAPTGGLTFAVSSSNTAIATVATSTVTIPAGSTTVGVPVHGVAPGTSTITVSAPHFVAASDIVTVIQSSEIIVPTSLTIGPGSVQTFPVTLATPPSSPVTVTLTNSNPAAATLNFDSISFNAGSTTPTRQPLITGVANGQTTITATAPGLGSAASTVNVAITASFMPPSLTIFGATGTGGLTLSLSSPAVSDTTFTLTSSNPSVATVPGLLHFTAGTQALGFNVTASSLGSTVIKASAPGFADVTANVSVQAIPPVTLSAASTTIQLGQSTTLTASIPAAAPIGGVTVTLNDNNSNTALATTTLTIPQGSTSATTQVNGLSLGNSNITGSAPNYLPSNTLTLQVGDTINWTTPTLTIVGNGHQGLLTLALGSAVPSGSSGITINLSSSNTSVVTVPLTATFAAGSGTHPTIQIPVTSVGPGTATIHASGLNIPDVDATVTVEATLAITTTSLPSGTVDSPYSAPIKATGGTLPYSYSATGLPSNLSINSSTGQITGTPVASGPSTVVVTVMDSSNPAASVSATFNLVINSAAPASIVATSGTPQSAKTGTAFAPFVVTVKDSHNNPVGGVVVTFTAPTSAPTGTFAGGVNTATTNASGMATSAVFTADNMTGNYSVTASVAGVSTPAIFTLTNLPGPAGSISETSGTGQSVQVGTAFPAPLVVTVKDASNNPVSGVVVTFTAPSSGASATFGGSNTTTVTTNSSGIATSPTVTANNTSGTYTVLATAAGVGTPASFALTNLTGPATSIAATGGTPQSASVNTTFASTLAATVTDAHGNPISGVTVTFSAPPTGASGTFANGTTSTSATTSTLGVATSSAFKANGNKGTYSVNATVAGVTTPATFTLTNAVGVPSSVTATGGTPQTAEPNAAFASPFSATVKDSGGNPLSGIVVTFTAPPSGASGTFAGAGLSTSATTNASGVATTSAAFTANGTLGSYSVTATVAGVSTPAIFALTNAIGQPASITATGGTPQSAQINTAFATALTATVKDSGGNLVSGVTVTFTAPPSGASGTFSGKVTSLSVPTNASGVASVTFTANSATGTYYVTASVPGVTSPALFKLTNIPGAPGSITITSGNPQAVTINTAFSPFVVLVKDSAGNPVNGTTVTFTAPTSGPGGTFAGGINTAVTNASGVATSAIFTANSKAGNYTVVASSGTASSAIFMLINNAGPAASMSVAGGSGQSAAINTAFANPLKVLVVDAGSNPVSGVTVTFQAPPSGASGTFGSSVTTTAVTDASGNATSASFTANNTVGPYKVTASAGSLSTSFSLNNTPGAPASIAIVSGSGQSATINTQFANPLVVIVKDAGGNPIPGASVTFNAPGSGASGTFANGINIATTDSTGKATSMAFTANSTAGTYKVTATAAPSVSISFSLTNNPTVPASITVAGGSSQSAVILTAFATPLSALVEDSGGNPVSGVPVTFTAPASGASGTFPGGALSATVNTVNGVATAPTFTANSVASQYSVVAAVSLTITTNFNLTNRQGPPAAVAVLSGSGQTTNVNTTFASPLQAVVTDVGGNTVPGVMVTFTAPSSGASGTFAGGSTTASATTNGAGIATSSAFSANGTAGLYSVLASVSGISSTAAFSLTNASVSGGPTITVTGANIGKNLEQTITITMSPGPTTTTPVTITSSDSTMALVGSGTILGKGTITPMIPAGEDTFQVFIQALVGSGSTTITVSAPGYSSASSAITFSPSGFAIAGTSGIGGNFSVYQGTTTPLTVYSGIVDANSGMFTTQEPIRGGYSVSVPVSSSNTAAGTVSPTSAAFTGGTSTASINLKANAGGTGSTTISVTEPSGFTTPSSGASVTATLQEVSFVPFNDTVGQGLEQSENVTLSGPAPGAITFTLTTTSPSLLFSTDPTMAGMQTLTITIAPGHSISAPFYVQSLASSGSASYTISADGYTSANGTVNFAPASLQLQSPGGLGAPSFTAPTSNPPATITAYTGYFDASSNFNQQPVAGGNPLTVNFVSSNPSVGTVNPASATIASGAGTSSTGGASTTLTPVAAGMTGVTASAQNFASAQVTANYTLQGLNLGLSCNDTTVGYDLSTQCLVSLPNNAGTGGQVVTIGSSSPSLLFVANSPVGTGTQSLQITIPAGGSTATFYAQVTSSSGSGNITVSSPGDTLASTMVTFAPSGVIIFPSTSGSPNSTGTVPVLVTWLDSTNTPQQGTDELLITGVTIGLQTSNSAVASVASTLNIPANSQLASLPVTFGSAGSATISLTQPAGFTTPNTDTSSSVTVQ